MHSDMPAISGKIFSLNRTLTIHHFKPPTINLHEENQNTN